MSIKNVKVLTIAQSIQPFMDGPEDMAKVARHMPQGILESGNEIRVFMPKWGCINERRHQLHEVIRLSGMNLIINDTDHALLIKVASVPSARMQVYFIDNDEYFKRKAEAYSKKDGKFFKDNDERALFFGRGVLETVRKLGWVPDIIHLHGWMTGFVPLYVRHLYADDPHFENTKLIMSVYDQPVEMLDKDMAKKLTMEGFDKDLLKGLTKTTTDDLVKFSLSMCDAVVKGSAKLNKGMDAAIKASSMPVLNFVKDGEHVAAHSDFYSTVLEEALV